MNTFNKGLHIADQLPSDYSIVECEQCELGKDYSYINRDAYSFIQENRDLVQVAIERSS